ncbi:Fc.00g016600.m01.CDS01 [Cosmosporella sp. VM-42]
MPITKPAVLLCSCNSLHAASPITSITSSFSGRQPPRQHTHSTRRYASVNHHRHAHGAFSHKGSDGTGWPKATYPTPYEIFAMKNDAPYTKKRFFELVKLYHPDKHSHSTAINHIPHPTRLERYRLIVAANDLLSDPAKRNLYDVHGVGWTGGKPQTLNETMRDADRSWRHKPGNAAHNATWEDWEKWYAAREGKPVDPLYMSNGLFASLVVVMCMIGAVAQMNRAGESGAEYMEMMNNSTEAVARQVARKTMAGAGLSKDERVDTFLRDRENVTYQFVPSRYENLDSEQEKP